MKTFKTLLVLLIMYGFANLTNAQMTTEKVTGPVIIIGNQCIGEDLIGTVTYNHTYRILDNPSNRFSYHWTTQGGFLVGQTSGNVYQFQMHYCENGKILPIELANGAWTWHHIEKVRIIGTGMYAANFSIYVLIKVTILPSGELAVEIVNIDERCYY